MSFYKSIWGDLISSGNVTDIADLPEFAKLHRNCSNARAAARELLPSYPRYPEAEIRRNIEVIQEFLRYAATKSPATDYTD